MVLYYSPIYVIRSWSILLYFIIVVSSIVDYIIPNCVYCMLVYNIILYYNLAYYILCYSNLAYYILVYYIII